MRCTLSIVAAALWGTGVVWAGGPAAQTPDQKRADALFTEGRKLIDTHDDLGACAKFGEAIKLDPDAAGTMLNLGLCNQNLAKYKTALYWFRKAQSRAHETGLAEYENAAGERTKQLASLVATVRIAFHESPPPGTRVKVDGEEIKIEDYEHAEVDPGHHALDAGAPGHKSIHQEFEVAGKGGQTLTIDLVVGDNSVIVDRGAGRRKAALFTAIGGGVLLVTSGAISLYAKQRYDGCLNGAAEPPATCGSNNENGRTYANHYHTMARWVATPIFAAGAVAVGIGAYLYFTAPQRERLDRTVWVPAVGPDQIGLAAAGAF